MQAAIFTQLTRLLLIIWAFPVILLGMRLYYIRVKYRKSQYGKISGNHFIEVAFNKGNYGEFKAFTLLEGISRNQKILTNLYLPKSDGTLTEADLVMIERTGVYVIESKNYRGWIYGDVKKKYWIQTFKGGMKNKFLNPIWQNAGHIAALQTVLHQFDKNAFHSYIVFSDNCRLKVQLLTDKDAVVLKRHTLALKLKKDIQERPEIFSGDEIEQIHAELIKFTGVSQATKAQHILNLKNKMDI